MASRYGCNVANPAAPLDGSADRFVNDPSAIHPFELIAGPWCPRDGPSRAKQQGPRPSRSGAFVVGHVMGERVPLVSVEELRKVVRLLLAMETADEELGLEAERVAHDLALRLPAD